MAGCTESVKSVLVRGFRGGSLEGKTHYSHIVRTCLSHSARALSRKVQIALHSGQILRFSYLSDTKSGEFLKKPVAYILLL